MELARGREGGVRAVPAGRPGTLEKPSGNVDHFCLGIDKFNRESVIRDLKARGVAPEPDEKSPQGFHVKDPDGFRVQLGDSSEF